MNDSDNVTLTVEIDDAHAAVELLAGNGFNPVLILPADPDGTPDGAMATVLAEGIVGGTPMTVLYDLGRSLFWIVTGHGPEFKRVIFGKSLDEFSLLYDLIADLDLPEPEMTVESVCEMRELLADAEQTWAEMSEVTGGPVG